MLRTNGNSDTCNILFHPSALSFIRTKNLMEPIILVNLVYRMGSGGCCGGASKPTPHVNVLLVNGRHPGVGFQKVETLEGVPIYLAKQLYEVAVNTGNPLMLNAKGVWKFKQMKLEGLDLRSLRNSINDSEKESCH